MADALAGGLQDREPTEPSCERHRRDRDAVFRTAFDRWVVDGKRRQLTEVITESLKALQVVTANGHPTPRRAKSGADGRRRPPARAGQLGRLARA